MRTLTIDFVSDVACPWCAVGLSALEQAMEKVRADIAVELHFQPFELNPRMPAGGEDTVEHLMRKYGISAEQVAQNQQHLHERGAQAGFRFNLDGRKRIYNTFDAHRLLHWAGEASDADAQRRLKHALLTAYFTDGLDPSDPAVLRAAAITAGLDGERATAIIEGDDYAAAVREREQHFLAQGIHSVPAVIINQRFLVQGGQPAETFEQALRQIAGQAITEAGEAAGSNGAQPAG